MKNIIKSIILLATMSVTMTSCLIDDEPLTNTFGTTPNFASFALLNQTLSVVADGNEATANIVLQLDGPSVEGLTSDINVTIAIDPASTAVEGVHYRLNSNSITLQKSANYIGIIPITVITAGVIPPLAVAPTLTLKITDTSGATNLALNSKSSELTFIYLCFADLAGTYLVTNDWCNPSFTTTIVKAADGSWRLGSADGGWLHQCTGNGTLLNGGNIVELCEEILPSGLLDYGTAGGFGIGDILSGTWDPDTGILSMQHRETFFNGGPREWNSTYTRQ